MKIVRKSQNTKDGDRIIFNNETIENVKEFVLLGTLITNNYDDTKEIRRRLCIARSAMVSLINIWKDKSIKLSLSSVTLSLNILMSFNAIERRNVAVIKIIQGFYPPPPPNNFQVSANIQVLGW